MSQTIGRGLVSTIRMMSNAGMISKLMGMNSKCNESCESVISKQTRRSLIQSKFIKSNKSEWEDESGTYGRHSLSQEGGEKVVHGADHSRLIE
jgi:hypothetical protein